jgi:hypothetical protein
MRDTKSKRQFTVMNDRAQGGSALKDGHVEFMQQRRIPADDGRGMGEFVNETDKYGHGIRVPATYYVQIFDRENEASVQRLIQQKVENPN